MPTKIDLKDPKNEIYEDLAIAISSCNSILLDDALNSKVGLDVIFKNSSGSEHTPLSYAVRCNNEEAVRRICAELRKVDPQILNTHLSLEILNTTLLHYASYIGNPHILRWLLAASGADSDPDARSGLKDDARGETPLMSAIRHLPSYSLIEEGDWDTEELKEKLRLWYEGNGDFPKEATTVTWNGNIKVINLLLAKSVDPTASDMYEISPYSLVTSLTDLKHHKNTFHDGTSNPKILSVSDDIIVFEAIIHDRKGHEDERQTIQVTYDFRKIRAMLAAKIKQNKDDGLEKDQKRFSELKERVEKLRAEQAPVVEEHKAKLEKEKMIKELCSNEGSRAFFENLIKGLNAQVTAAVLVLSGEIERTRDKRLDKGSKAAEALVSLLPGGSLFGKAVGAGVGYLSDRNEKGKNTNIRDNVPLKIQEFCEDIAIQTLEQCPQIKQLSAARATKLVEMTIKMCATILSKSKTDGKDVKQVILDSVKKEDGEFQKQLTKLNLEQTKDEAKQEAKAKAEREAKAKVEAKEKAAKAKQDTKVSTLVQYSQYSAVQKQEDEKAHIIASVASRKPLSPAALRAASAGAAS